MPVRSNIFAVDVDAVLRAISAANSQLLKRHKNLMQAHERAPLCLQTEDDIERARLFAEILSEHIKRCRAARLSDTKPLRKLLQRTEDFFKRMETQTARVRAEIMDLLGEVARRQASPNTAVPHCENGTPATCDGQLVVVQSNEDEVAVVTPTKREVPAPSSKVTLIWQVETVDRLTLDLEALRSYLTDSALMAAARKHLKEQGPHSLRGASYTQVAALQ